MNTSKDNSATFILLSYIFTLLDQRFGGYRAMFMVNNKDALRGRTLHTIRILRGIMPNLTLEDAKDFIDGGQPLMVENVRQYDAITSLLMFAGVEFQATTRMYQPTSVRELVRDAAGEGWLSLPSVEYKLNDNVTVLLPPSKTAGVRTGACRYLHEITGLPESQIEDWFQGRSLLIIEDEAVWDRLYAAMMLAGIDASVIVAPLPF